MTILARDPRWYGSAVMPNDDSATNIGGGIDLSIQIAFVNVAGLVQVVSDDSTDTEDVAITYRNAGQVIVEEIQTLNGLTPVPYAGVMQRLLSGTKAGPTVGNVAVEGQTAVRTGTAQDGTADSITLDAGASAVDGFYRSKVIRLTSGTGVGQIRRIVQYTGADKIALVSRPWSPVPDATTAFRIANGFFFEIEPDECLEMRRLHYNAAAEAIGGAARDYYDKFFVKNLGSEALLTAIVAENADPEGQFDFALESTVNGSGTNGGTRQTAPISGVTAFTNLAKAVPGVDLGSGDAIGVWSHLALPAGDLSTDTTLAIQISGT